MHAKYNTENCLEKQTRWFEHFEMYIVYFSF